jgi:hypothetical protein
VLHNYTCISDLLVLVSAGSPFSCVVDKLKDGFVTAFGVGLVGGLSGEEEQFTVVAKQGTASECRVACFVIVEIVKIILAKQGTASVASFVSVEIV